MKAVTVVAFVSLLAAPGAIGQQAAQDPVADSLIALENRVWDAWKNADAEFFEGYLADDALFVSPWGTANKEQQLQGFAESPCDVRDFSLDNFKVLKLGEDARLITYSANQDATCEGTELPKEVLATSVYVREGYEWVSKLYQETPVADEHE